jgi:hypothetical protein
VGIESSVGLVVAAMDLEVVRLLRAAMGPRCGCGGPLDLIHPGPRFEPRKRVEPEPKIEPRRHIHPAPRFEPRMKLRGGELKAACAQVAPAEPEEPAARSTSPVEPPWKVRPWEQNPPPPPRPVRKIKVFLTRSDSYCKGSVIDLFI